jgi:hypothetical protein
MSVWREDVTHLATSLSPTITSGARYPAVPVVPVFMVVPVTNLETPKSLTTAMILESLSVLAI